MHMHVEAVGAPAGSRCRSMPGSGYHSGAASCPGAAPCLEVHAKTPTVADEPSEDTRTCRCRAWVGVGMGMGVSGMRVEVAVGVRGLKVREEEEETEEKGTH